MCNFCRKLSYEHEQKGAVMNVTNGAHGPVETVSAES